MLITRVDELKRFYSANRRWQGIPGIERTEKGRLFATFYSGGGGEQPGNYCVLVKSDDDGASWSEPIAAAFHGDDYYRAYDPCLWIDPLKRLWFIWSRMPGYEIYYSRCDNPDDDNLVWTEHRQIAYGVMLNKPTVLSSGEWLFPCALWSEAVMKRCNKGKGYEPPDFFESERKAYVYRTTDNGETFVRLGGVDAPERCFDEHMVLEKKDGTLEMYIRTFYGIGKTISYDRGISWTEAIDSGLGGPNSRFFIRRLKSGNILLLNHFISPLKMTRCSLRTHISAMLSKDEGQSWYGFLTIDERDYVSYPDAIEADNGYIYIIYDRDRNGEKEILMAKVTEDDIASGKIKDPDSRLKVIVSKV